MKKVIIPMDFTEVSLNAFDYAIKCFEDATFEVVHVTKSMVSINEPKSAESAKSKFEILKDHLSDLIRAEFGSELFDKVQIEVMILEGDTVPQIRKYIDRNKFDAMVIGTRDKYDFFDRWIGTISLGLVKTLNIPVYLVPRYAHYKKLKRVLVASDYHPENRKVISLLKKWNEIHQAFVKFLHIHTGDSDYDISGSELIINELVAENDPSFGFELAVIQDKNITQSILSSAYNFKADLLVVIPENQSFIHSLLFKSLSKELILQSAIPVLFVHKDDTL